MPSRKEYNDTIERCIKHNLPFVLYMPADLDDVIFFSQRPDENNECRADLADPEWNGFFINFFNNDEPYTAGVAYDYDYDETLTELTELERLDGLYMPADVVPSLRSTTELQHQAAVRQAVSEIKKYSGKVVLSQMTAVVTERPVGEVMWEYFDMFPSTFRYLVFTPETGLWLGASPELLARCLTEQKTVISMALAGTMPADSDEEWDKKNIQEHHYVGSHILQTLQILGLKTDYSSTEELQFGPVKHLCTYFCGEGDYDPVALLYALSPTPAVAGYPSRDEAVRLIEKLESHQRYCYTGFVGVKSDNDIEAYVNLRSALISPCMYDFDARGYLYNIYSGGGIMPQSDPESEWKEVQAKMSALLGVVTAKGSVSIDKIKDTVFFPESASRRDFLMSNRYVK